MSNLTLSFITMLIGEIYLILSILKDFVKIKKIDDYLFESEFLTLTNTHANLRKNTYR